MNLAAVFRGAFLALLAILADGCAGRAVKPAEVLDEQTGMTVGALQEPIEFVEKSASAGANSQRTSFAYLGPIEWDRMGEITYGLWIHVAPGNDRQVSDLHTHGAVTLMLEDGPLPLSVLETPGAGRGPYKPVASWGQTAYFQLNLEMLKRMAASQKMAIEFRAADASRVEFLPSHSASVPLREFARTRGVSGD